MSLEREFKVGDRVCSFNGKKGVVLKLEKYPISFLNSVFVKWGDGSESGVAESRIWHEGDTPKFDYMAHQAQLEHEENLKRAEERRKIERAFDDELKTYPQWLKYHINDRVFYPMYGCGTVLVASPHVVRVKFANDYERSLDTCPPLRFATEEDEQCDPCAVVFAPEPVDETASLERLVVAIERWAKIVLYLDGDDDYDEIKHDLFTRECLHGFLNGLKKQGVTIPEDIREKLAQADQYFIEHSVMDALPDVDKLKKRSPCMGPITLLDPKAFWYEYRWPKCKKQT